MTVSWTPQNSLRLSAGGHTGIPSASAADPNVLFFSWCDGQALQIFSLTNANQDGGGYNDRATYLSTSAAWNRVKAKGADGAMMVPSCYRSFDVKAAVATADTATWTVEARGEVRITVRADASGAARKSLPEIAREVESKYTECLKAYGNETLCLQHRKEAQDARASFWAPTGRSPTTGIRMVKAHALKLMDEVGKEYGHLLATKDVVVVIDVLPSPGVPRSRWLYVSRPVFLAINPSMLYFLSAGLLVPELKHYQVSFQDAGCDLNFTNYVVESDGSTVYADQSARFTAIYEQLYYAMHSDGGSIFNTAIRGRLVLLGSRSSGVPKYSFLKTTSGWEMEQHEPSALDEQMKIAVWLSVALGCVWGVILSFGIMRYLQNLLQFTEKEERVRQKTLAMYGMADCAAPQDEDSFAGGSDGNSWSLYGKWRQVAHALHSNPFSRPITLIDTLVLAPLRRYYVDALSKFVCERCLNTNDVAPKNKIAATVRFTQHDQIPSAEHRFHCRTPTVNQRPHHLFTCATSNAVLTCSA
jgi:hypothetical protein